MENRPAEHDIYMRVGRDTSVNEGLEFPAFGVSVDNNTSQWVYVSDANRFVAPNTSRQFGLYAARSGKAVFQAPPGKTQPAAITGEECILVFTSEALPTTGAQVPSVLAAIVTTPACAAFNSVLQTLTTGITTVLKFDSERYDTDAMHDPVVNNTRISIKTSGKYLLTANAEFAASIAGTKRLLAIRINGVTFIGITQVVPVTGPGVVVVPCVAQWDTVVGDYFEVLALQDSGGNLDIDFVASYSPEFCAVRIA